MIRLIVRLSTGHTITVSDRYLDISGDLDTMDAIPESEIDAACASAGVICTYDPASATSYGVEPIADCEPTASESPMGWRNEVLRSTIDRRDK